MFNDSDGILTGNGTLYHNGTYCNIIKDTNSSSTYNPQIGSGQTNMTGCFNTTANKENNLTGMLYTNYTIEHIPATFVGNQAMPQYTYLEFDNSHIDNTAYNGSVFTYYYQGSLYNTINLKLGNIVNNDSYYYECKLLDDNNFEVGTSFVSLNVNPIDIYNDGALYIDNHQSIYVVTRNISYNKQYKLVITSYYDGGSSLNEDIDWFLFLPLNSVVSGDYILSFGSGDGFGLIDSTGQIIDSSEEQTASIISSLTDFSPLSSGDILSNVDIIPMYTYSSGDDIGGFFVDILQHISDVFLLDNEVTLHLTLPVFSHEINIRSDFWISAEYFPQLAEFINYAWWFIICLGMLYKIDVLVELYNFGDFIKASYLIYQTRRLL